MENYEQDKTIQLCLTIVFSIGVITVLLYVLFGNIYAVYASLGIYAFSFSLLSLFAIRKLFVIAHYKERLKKFETRVEMSDEEKLEYESKKSEAIKIVNKAKTVEIIKAIISGAIAIFAVVVLVLF